MKAELPLPVAGLLSDAPLAEVVEASEACVEAARALGCTYPSPFQTMSFWRSVIPALKITDRGLVDVDRFELVLLAAEPQNRMSDPARRRGSSFCLGL